MKKIVLLIMCVSYLSVYSQIGIGTTSPNGALDINITNDGLLIPRIALSATNVATVLTPTVSELVYNTFTSAAGPNQVTPGFYFWTGSTWARVGTGNNTDWSLTGNSGIVPTTNFLGTINSADLRIRTGNADRFDFTSNGRLRSYDNGTTGQPTYSWSGDIDTGIWRPSADNLAFSTNALERMRINNSGQVVINNTTPIAGDRFSVYNTTTSDYAVNGYSTATGTGVYGENTGAGLGVYGRNTSGTAVYGTTGGASGAGVFGVGNAGFGTGVYGTSSGASGTGLWGNATGNLGIGVYGQSSGTTGTGVFGYANNTNGDGVYGQATQALANGVWGVNNNANGNGVYGSSTGTNGYGVLGNTTGTNSVGVYGNSTDGVGVRGFSTNQNGVFGTTTSSSSFGVIGTNTTSTGVGIVGAGNSLPPTYLTSGSGGAFTGSRYGSVAFATTVANGNGMAASGNNQTITIYAQGSGATFTGLQWGTGGVSALTGAANNGTNRAAFIGNYVSAGTTLETVYVGARIGGTHYKILGTGGGSVSTTMPTSQGERILFAPESPENWFFDIGEVELVNGKAKVFLDPILIECISDSKPFKVFVQGAENTLGSIKITRNQKEKYFEIEDLGGQSNGSVMYNIYALWKGKENLRFPELKPEDKSIAMKVESKNIEISSIETRPEKSEKERPKKVIQLPKVEKTNQLEPK